MDTSNEISAHVLTVVLVTYKAMGLCHNFDEKMKGNSKLLITEATFGFVSFFFINIFDIFISAILFQAGTVVSTYCIHLLSLECAKI